MSRQTDAKCRLCRREGVPLFLKGNRCLTGKCAVKRRENAPGQHSWRKGRRSAYGDRLREKQKLKRYYGLVEEQFRRMFSMAERQKGNTGENLIVLLERRLDNVVFAMGFALSRPHARQLIRHGHFTVNGHRLDIPSALVKAGDEIAPADKDRAKKLVVDAIEQTRSRQVPSWLEISHDPPKARVVQLPRRDDLKNIEVNDLFVVEVMKR
jgi:small subunit ribosomal protein S4